MTNSETITITETAPDGTETVIEITTTKPDETLAETDAPSIIEEVIEAIFDENPSDDSEYLVEPDFNEETADENSEDYSISEELAVESELPQDDFSSTPFAAVDETPFANPSHLSSDTETAETDSAEEAQRAEEARLEAHADAARDAQAAADEFIAEGDYAAAAEAREVAENEAYAAGDDSMLSAYDSSDLENAAYAQENAEYYQERQAEFAREGDYESAREAASDAVFATRDADMLAGGDDHTGQARAEEYQMDWAVWQEKNADYNAQAAEQYAAEGDFEKAEIYAAEAVEHQEAADYHGDLGEHGGEMAVYDPSSDVSSGGSYDSTYDASADTSAIDTSTDFSSE